jgi:hypothetical protein
MTTERQKHWLDYSYCFMFILYKNTFSQGQIVYKEYTWNLNSVPADQQF